MRKARGILAVATLLALGLTAVRFAQDSGLRRAARNFARVADIERARPEESAAMAAEPAGDLAAAMAVSALLQSSPDNPTEILREGNRLMLDAVASRPGWGFHRYLAGRTTADKGRARRAMRLGAQAAPGMDAIWLAVGRAELSAWSELAAAERAEAPDVFRRCFLDESFASSDLAAVSATLGRERALSLLPEDATILDAAAGSLAAGGDIPGAALLLQRADAAERLERAEDLAALERLARLGDVEGLRSGCRSWFDRHPYQELDDAQGRAQVARLLALWPDIRFGAWSRDRRARLVRFFLDGRASQVPGPVLLRTIESLTDVPDAVRARVLVLAGSLAAARAIEQAGVRIGSTEWDPYYLELARSRVQAGNPDDARRALSRLSLSAGDACEGLLARRAVARLLRDREDLAVLEQRLAPLREVSAEDWAKSGTLSLCIDPEWVADKSLEISVGPGSATLLAWGWDGGRAGTVSLPPERAAFRVPLPGFSGAHALWTSYLMGGEGRALQSTFKATS